MKNSILIFLLLSASIISSQDALIGDIMSVAPVVVELDDSVIEQSAEFDKDLEEEKTKVENLLAKNSEKYKKDITELIEKYNKVLGKAIEQDVDNEKRRVATQANTLTISLRKSKKDVIQQFENRMKSNIRELHKDLQEDKEEAVYEVIGTYRKSFDTEYKANQKVISQFKKTEHLQKSMEKAEG